MAQKLAAEHGVIHSLPNDFFGYFGWPSVARMDDGTLVGVASGLRHAHVCPFGRTTLAVSRDGATWSSPRVVNDFPIDDRDAGVVSLGGNELLVSWFTSDTRKYYSEERLAQLDPMDRAHFERGLAWQTEENIARWLGSWVRVSRDGGELWDDPVRVSVTAPHGPIRLRDGALLYLGKVFGGNMREFTEGVGGVMAMRSDDRGASWRKLGNVPIYPGTSVANYHEPHVVELPSGKLIGAIRIQSYGEDADIEKVGLVNFGIAMTESTDGGATWTQANPLNFHGSPPHLLRHSSGTLVMVYGYRLEPYGQRAALSRDEGETWQHDFIIRDDGPDGDLGYPASVEMPDGGILTVYYQKPHGTQDKCAFLWSQWRLP